MFAHFYKDVFCLFLFFAVVFLTVSCGKEGEERVEAVYDVCESWELPDELTQLIEEKKTEEFQLVYENSSYQYLAAGYGEQPEKYVAAVKTLEETKDRIYADFILVSRENLGDRAAGEASLCPYIVLRLEKNGKTVLFQ